MKAEQVARAVEFLTIHLALELECALANLRSARKRGWDNTQHACWVGWNERQVSVRRAARSLREAYGTARSLGLAGEFLAVCRRISAGRKGGGR